MSYMPELTRPPRPPSQYVECAVAGCGRCPRSFSRYCTLHARNFHRCRDPNGRIVRHRELVPYIELAEVFLKRNEKHPTVVAAVAWLRQCLTDQTMPADIRRQFERLQRDGADTRAMLINFLSVWGLRFYLPNTVTSDACEAVNLGTKVLRTSPLPTFIGPNGTPQPTRLPPRVAEATGVILRETLGPFAEAFWKYVQLELDAPARAAKAVRDALRESPLGCQQVLGQRAGEAA